jgi:hypothetical protein
MFRPIEGFLQNLEPYFREHPELRDDENVRAAQASLREIVTRSFESQQEIIQEVSHITEVVRRSGNEELAQVMERVFNQEIRRLQLPSATQGSPAKLQRRETSTEVPCTANMLFGDILQKIFFFSDPRTRAAEARVCKCWHRELQTVRIFELSQFRSEESRDLLPRFGIQIPDNHPSSAEVVAVCKDIYEKAADILRDISECRELSAEEKAPFLSMDARTTPQNPGQFFAIVLVAQDVSFIVPFLRVRNGGPDLSGKNRCVGRVIAIRQHLEKYGDRYRTLDCKGSQMRCIPREFCYLKNLRSLDLSVNKLTAVSSEIWSLGQLQFLSLRKNQLTVVPSEIWGLRQLRVLELDENKLTVLPPGIGRLEQLQLLVLSKNQLTAVPSEIGRLGRLQGLALAENKLTDLPPEIEGLEQLSSVNLSENRFTALPAQIKSLQDRFHRLYIAYEPQQVPQCSSSFPAL